MKITRSQWILVATACVIVAGSAAQSVADRPPGVDEDSWVPISDTAGIVLTDVSPSFPTAMGQLPRNGTPAIIPQLLPQFGSGVLMVKNGSRWMRVDLQPPPARVQPAL